MPRGHALREERVARDDVRGAETFGGKRRHDPQITQKTQI
jgi:hypothetical protein